MSAQSVSTREASWSRSVIQRRDVAIALAVGVIQVVGTAWIEQHTGHTHPRCWWGSCHSLHRLDGGALVLLLVGPLALLFRRRHAVAVLAIVFAATAVYAAIGYPAGPIFLSLIVAFVTVVAQGHRLLGWLAVAVGWAVFLWLPAAVGPSGTPSLGEALALAAWLLVLRTAAEAIRARRERAATLARRRREEGVRRAEEERLRIARELHDVLAHNISLINVQSGVALHLLEEQPEQARTALSVINDASAEALREMRSVLGVLRRVDEQAPRAPTAGLAALDALVARSAAAGVTVDLQIGGSRRPLPTSVDLAAFRIVQESLTNVARHSGSAAATVLVRYGADGLELQIDDSGSGASGVSGGGSGIVGMRERAAALGGELTAGARPGGGFRVRARLPVVRERDEPG